MPIPDAIRPSGSQRMDDPGVEGATVIDNVQDRIDWLETAKAETSAVLTTEQVQDLVAAMIVAGANVSATYDDAAGTLTISSTGGGGGSMTSEEIEDLLASSFVGGAGISVTYSDAGNSFTITNTDRGATAVAAHHAPSSTDHDDRYYTEAEVDAALAGKAATSHVHSGADITSGTVPVGRLPTGTSGSTVALGNHTHTAVYSGSETFGVSGAVTTRTGAQRIYNDSGRTRTIVAVRASAGTAPTGASLICDVNKGGTTIFGTQSARPTIAVSTNTNKTTGHTVTTWADGEYLTVDVDQIGSTVAGSDLSVTIEWS